MDFKEVGNFYILSSKFLGSALQVHQILDSDAAVADENGLYEHHRLLLGDYVESKFPVVFKQQGGSKLTDLLDTGTATLFLISDKLKQILYEKNFKGWDTFPVKVLGKDEKEVSGYSGFSVTGKSGKVNFGNSKIVYKEMIKDGPKQKYFKGLSSDLSKWDGSDLFVPKGFFGIIVSQEVRDALVKGKLTNVEFTNVNDILTPDFAIEL